MWHSTIDACVHKYYGKEIFIIHKDRRLNVRTMCLQFLKLKIHENNNENGRRSTKDDWRLNEGFAYVDECRNDEDDLDNLFF